ncbi:MAG: GAF domain-containing sensor histidine kinase [Deltaproteobacteria bacterium]|nr:GAF domain-containing sensor histidine kinase [Deltaproteobacteria bacterium]MBI3386269.1 GAF domain-containing sensor histidine kinase [Deltaproteobacteria bacterium]
MLDSTATSATIHAAYRRDADELTARHFGLAAAIFLGVVGIAAVFEVIYYRDRWPWFVVVFAPELLGGSAVFLLRERLLRYGLVTRACVALSSNVALALNTYVVIVRGAPEMSAVGLVCVMSGLPLLFPWGVWGQLTVAVAAVIGFIGALAIIPTAAVPWPYVLFVFAIGAFTSVIGAHYLDLHRWAIFREASLKDDEATVTRALLQIADDLNTSLDTSAVIERIARSTTTTLGASWTIILLWDERRRVFRLAGTDPPNAQTGALASIEYVPGAFPLIERALREDTVCVTADDDLDQVTAVFLQRYRTAVMLLTRLSRGDRLIGVLITGRRPDAFAPNAPRLLRGIAHQAAIALDNVRLVSDLRQADRMKSDFVATMSHELRTPLNVILGYNELLLDEAFGPLSAEQRRTVERSQASSSDLLELINATLNVNRLEAGQSPVRIEDVQLNVLVEDLAAEVTRLPRKPGVELRWSLNGGPPMVRSDRGKLKIIIKNLVNNALKFTDQGHVTVSIHHQAEPHELEVAVADTGIGIAASEVPQIFEMFQQGASVNGRPTSGVGLGLYIVRRYVEQLGGHIDVQSGAGSGSTFRVRLPLSDSERRAA